MTAYAFDEELARALPHLPRLDFGDLEGTREVLRSARAARSTFTLPDGVRLTPRLVPVGTRSVTVQVFSSVDPVDAGALLWFHGGGFVIGDALMDAAWNAELANRLGTVVVSVNYSLAPEHRFPIQIDEASAALAWLAEHVRDLGVDPERIAVGGQSAGACIAAALALVTRDSGGPDIAFQALDIPVVDDRSATASMADYDDTPYWTRTSSQIGWNAYLGALDGAPPASASPARADDLRGLPPAFVTVCQFDPLRDEGIDYARRLAQAGVPTELHLYPGTFHGSGVVVAAEVSQRMRRDFADALARGLGTPKGGRINQ